MPSDFGVFKDCMGAVSVRRQSQPDGSPVTVVNGEFLDQAALAGALCLLYDLGMPLLSVECIAFDPDNPAGFSASDTMADGGSGANNLGIAHPHNC